MYEQFFGLRERPFDLLPNPRFLYLADGHREARANLRYSLLAPRGITLITGDAGTGKTTLATAVLAEADSVSVRVVQITNPTLTRQEFYETLTMGFDLGAIQEWTKPKFLSQLRDRLETDRLANIVWAVLIDEAQSLPDDLLEEIRLLSNIETPTSKLLSVILIGQSELAVRLNRPDLQQLKQRISLRYHLGPLTLVEAAGYIVSRLVAAGGKPTAVFTRDAVKLIYLASRGIPRTISVLCDNAMLAGFAKGLRPVGVRVVEEVCRDFDLEGGVPADAHATLPAGADANPIRPAADHPFVPADTTRVSSSPSRALFDQAR
jgi:general secretion pathway protein A